MKNLLAPLQSSTELFSNYTIKIIIVVFSFVLYLNTLNHGFVLDDVAVVEQNQFVKKGIKGIPEILTTFYWQGFTNANAGLYRPLSLIFFAAEYEISPNQPKIHHFFNIVYYSLCCLLLYNVLLVLFSKINRLFIFGCILMFIAHPIHTEVVANIKSRDEIFSLLFFLLTLLLLYHPKYSKNQVYKILGFFTFFLSLLSKENSIMFLPIIFLYDFYFSSNILKSIKSILPILVITAIWLIIHQLVVSNSSDVIQYTFKDNSILSSSSVLDQKATALGIFARYYLKAFYPYEMAYDYSFSQVPIIHLYSPFAIIGMLFFVASIYAIIKFYKSEPFISIALSMMFFQLLLTSNVLFFIGTTMADRFLFIPSIGSVLILGLLVSKITKLHSSENRINQISFLIIITSISGLYSMKTYTRNMDWESNYVLFEKDVVRVPKSAKVQYNYGIVMMGFSSNVKDQFHTKAKYAFQKCIELDTTYVSCMVNLGVLYYKEKDFPNTFFWYNRALKYNANDPNLNGNIGEAYFRLNTYDSAIVYFNKAQKFGNKSNAINNFLGTSYFSKSNYKNAIHFFEKAIAADSTNWNLYMNYGNALVMDNQDPKGIDALQKSVSLNPNNKQTYYFLALTYNKIKDIPNAQKYLNIYNGR
jgi:tetratricopeptide (TPR) repeat protein